MYDSDVCKAAPGLARASNHHDYFYILFNKPGVAGAVLQTPLSFIYWLTHSSFEIIFKTPSLPNCKS